MWSPDPESTRLGHQPEANRPTIGFREVVKDDTAPRASGFGDAAAAVQQLRVPDEQVALAGAEQFALQSVPLHFAAHPHLPRAQLSGNEMALAVGKDIRRDPVATGPIAQPAGFRRAILQRHPCRDEVGGRTRCHEE